MKSKSKFQVFRKKVLFFLKKREKGTVLLYYSFDGTIGLCHDRKVKGKEFL